jgi:Flp pilus assembly protein TadG
MVLVAIAMVAIIAMAALSIDVITLYLAREEAQRSADAAALAAARVISLSGITGDPNNSTSSWQVICGGSGSPATQTVTAVATQNAVGRAAADTVNVTYSAGGRSGSDCSSLPAAFGVNPMVTVQVIRASLPTFFSRIWGNKGNTVSATATAEAFNPSYSVSAGNQTTGTIIPVQPRCVKPWVVPNRDPWNPGQTRNGFCDQPGNPACQKIVSTSDGSITNPGISLNGTNATGVIGEKFWLAPDCAYSGSACTLRGFPNPPQANLPQSQHIQPPPNLAYLPGQMVSSSSAVPSCSTTGSLYEQAIAGCDQSTVYQCGVQSSSSPNHNLVDLSENPATSGDTMNGVQCLINAGAHATDPFDGEDTLNPYEKPSSYPFQILAGRNNPVVKAGLASGTPVTSSNSIISLPIFDSGNTIASRGQSPVTIVGFLQVFINGVDNNGNVDVTVLNVAGCSNGQGPNLVGNPVFGSSPVPVRLITPQ